MTSVASASVPGDLNAIVRCAVGQEEYALAAADAMLVARAEQMSIAMDGALVGRIRHQERNVPVYSLAALFGGRATRLLADHHIVVSGGANRPIGLLVDRLVRVPDSRGAEPLPIPRVAGPQAPAWFRGLLRLGGRHDRALVAVAVDGDLTLHPASPDDRAIATIEVPDFVRGVFDAGGEAVALVDPDRLMLSAAASVHAAARVA